MPDKKYEDFKIVPADNNKDVADKHNNFLETLEEDLNAKLEADSYILADDIRAEFLYNLNDINSGNNHAWDNPAYTGVFKLIDSRLLQGILSSGNTSLNNLEQLLSNLFYFLVLFLYNTYKGQLLLSNIIQAIQGYSEDMLDDQDIYSYRFISGLLKTIVDLFISKEPAVYKISWRIDENTLEDIRILFLNGVAQLGYSQKIDVNSGRAISDTEYFDIPDNYYPENRMLGCLEVFFDKYVPDVYKQSWKNQYQTIFQIHSIFTGNPIDNIVKPTHNYLGNATQGLRFLGKVHSDVLVLSTKPKTQTKDELYTALQNGESLELTDSDTNATLFNGFKYVQDLYALLTTLDNYILALNIPCSDGNLCFLAFVQDTITIVVVDRLDNKSPSSYYAFNFVPQISNTLLKEQCVLQASGRLDLTDSKNLNCLLYFPDYTASKNYKSNTVLFHKDYDKGQEVDIRMMSGYNNVMYPAEDISNNPVTSAGGSFDLLASYNPPNPTNPDDIAYSDLGYIPMEKFKGDIKAETVGDYREGEDIYSLGLKEHVIDDESNILSVLDLPYGRNLLYKTLDGEPQDASLREGSLPVIIKLKRKHKTDTDVKIVDVYYAKAMKADGSEEQQSFKYHGVYNAELFPAFHWTSYRGNTFANDLSYGYTASENISYSATKSFLAVDNDGVITRMPKAELAGLTSIDLETQTTGVLSVDKGGTGKSTATEAYTALGGKALGKLDSIALTDSKLTGILPSNKGGTGQNIPSMGYPIQFLNAARINAFFGWDSSKNTYTLQELATSLPVYSMVYIAFSDINITDWTSKLSYCPRNPGLLFKYSNGNTYIQLLGSRADPKPYIFHSGDLGVTWTAFRPYNSIWQFNDLAKFLGLSGAITTLDFTNALVSKGVYGYFRTGWVWKSQSPSNSYVAWITDLPNSPSSLEVCEVDNNGCLLKARQAFNNVSEWSWGRSSDGTNTGWKPLFRSDGTAYINSTNLKEVTAVYASDMRNSLGLGDTTHATIRPYNIEFPGASTNGGYIDFHYGNSTADYTSRIIEDGNGLLSIAAPKGVRINGNYVGTTTTEYIETSTGKWIATQLSNGKKLLQGFSLKTIGTFDGLISNMYAFTPPYTVQKDIIHIAGIYETSTLRYPVIVSSYGELVGTEFKNLMIQPLKEGTTIDTGKKLLLYMTAITA